MLFRRVTRRRGEKVRGTLLRHLQSQYRVSPSTLDDMRLVKREVMMGSCPLGITMFRIYDLAHAKEKDVTVDRFESLDNHPERIVYEG